MSRLNTGATFENEQIGSAFFFEILAFCSVKLNEYFLFLKIMIVYSKDE